MHPRPGNLRAVAEQIERATSLRVEILGGSLVMSPTPRGKHAGTIRRVRQQLEPRMPVGFASYEVSSIPMPGDADDYCTPDLVVLPESWDEDDAWLADPADVELAIEVISKSEKAKQITDKTGWYSTAGVRTLLVLDPRFGRWSLHTHPKDGVYHGLLDGTYSDPVPLPDPFGFEIDTGCLPLYAD
ncbi:Uma2 family endonuclease [Nocardia huaxiensis]|uniref:Uma2 family endonuclease n=1 Tax=Nocardia huaxiensis TaxID=2755382 RepID=A0A7D6ZBE7_9NOCA|nr:Uma2 family endonuclease [Nocardia huaxiensis]QLY31508.1 Uma2 family endonuclease [Nocardia huaxiensis]UFS95061.1 Uma2 family endonuclease [Nocardia huaxiensis]